MRFLTNPSTDPWYNMSFDEYCLEQYPSDDSFFYLWRNAPSVIIGLNQNAYSEVNLGYLQAHDIRLARRVTGGGAVYQDTGNLNVSFIAPADSLNELICEGILLKALEKCGVKARKTGRNDLVIDDTEPEVPGEGGKFSGSASWMTPEGNFLFHATIMFTVDLERMTAVLNASPDKLARHRIASVRSRVTNLSDHYPDLRMETLMRAIISETAAFCQM